MMLIWLEVTRRYEFEHKNWFELIFFFFCKMSGCKFVIYKKIFERKEDFYPLEDSLEKMLI